MKLVWNKEEDCAALTLTPDEQIVIFMALSERKITVEKLVVDEHYDDNFRTMYKKDLEIIKEALKLL